jgi:hypothetical protein
MPTHTKNITETNFKLEINQFSVDEPFSSQDSKTQTVLKSFQCKVLQNKSDALVGRV